MLGCDLGLVTEGPSVEDVIVTKGAGVKDAIVTKGAGVKDAIVTKGAGVEDTIVTEGPSVEDVIVTEGPSVDGDNVTGGSVDWRSIAGWDKVDRLTDYLLRFTDLALSAELVMGTLLRYNELYDYDKGRTVFPARHLDRQLTGRFKASKRKSGVAPGVDSTRR
jgi:hypothetical protein